MVRQLTHGKVCLTLNLPDADPWRMLYESIDLFSCMLLQPLQRKRHEYEKTMEFNYFLKRYCMREMTITKRITNLKQCNGKAYIPVNQKITKKVNDEPG